MLQPIDALTHSQTKPFTSGDDALQNEIFELSDVETETLRRAAADRNLSFDSVRKTYFKFELERYGLVREGFTKQELEHLGFRAGSVSCFDESAKRAEQLLRVDTPYGSAIQKWQLPIVSRQMRIEQTIFPANSFVAPHVHPINSPTDTGGGLRIVIKGKIFYRGFVYQAGDWFFVPNGTPYSFTTDPEGETVVMYKYAFFGDEHENRFSHPSAEKEVDKVSLSVGRLALCEAD